MTSAEESIAAVKETLWLIEGEATAILSGLITDATERYLKETERCLKSASEKFAGVVYDRAANHIAEKLRGETLFKAEERKPFLLKTYSYTPRPDEVEVFVWRESRWGDVNRYYVSNYGAVVRESISAKGATFHDLTRERGCRLTEEVISYFTCILPFPGDTFVPFLKKILDEYDKKWAFAHNKIHDTELAAVRNEIRSEFDAVAEVNAATARDNAEKSEKIRGERAALDAEWTQRKTQAALDAERLRLTAELSEIAKIRAELRLERESIAARMTVALGIEQDAQRRVDMATEMAAMAARLLSEAGKTQEEIDAIYADMGMCRPREIRNEPDVKFT